MTNYEDKKSDLRDAISQLYKQLSLLEKHHQLLDELDNTIQPDGYHIQKPHIVVHPYDGELVVDYTTIELGEEQITAQLLNPIKQLLTELGIVSHKTNRFKNIIGNSITYRITTELNSLPVRIEADAHSLPDCEIVEEEVTVTRYKLICNEEEADNEI